MGRKVTTGSSLTKPIQFRVSFKEAEKIEEWEKRTGWSIKILSRALALDFLNRPQDKDFYARIAAILEHARTV